MSTSEPGEEAHWPTAGRVVVGASKRVDNSKMAANQAYEEAMDDGKSCVKIGYDVIDYKI